MRVDGQGRTNLRWCHSRTGSNPQSQTLRFNALHAKNVRSLLCLQIIRTPWPNQEFSHEKERPEPHDGLTGVILKAYRHPVGCIFQQKPQRSTQKFAIINMIAVSMRL